jgi:PAS domain S-box-containing protein
MNLPTMKKNIKNDQVGQQMMWQLLPLVIVLPIFLGGLIAWGEWLKYYDKFFALMIGVIITIIIFVVLIINNAAILNRLDYERQQAEEALHQSYDHLQQRIDERTAELIAANLQLQQEVQEHRQTESTLRQSQQELADFVENAIVGLHWVAADGTIIWANQAELDLLGYNREEYIGHSITEFHADQIVIADILQRLLSNQPVQEYEADLRCKDGSIRHVLIDSNSFWSNGKFIRTRCFTRDITEKQIALRERQNIEEALRQSEQKFRAIFDGTFQFIGLLTPQGIVIEANKPALDAIAANLADVAGQAFWATPWWTHSPILQRQLQDAIAKAAQGELVRFEAEHILANGSSIFVDFSLKPIFDQQGQVIMLIPEGRDINDRKKTELALQNRQQELARSNAELQQFAYVASHDLQEPLRMITSYLELLERRYKGQLDDKADKFIAYAVDGATRMQVLINDLLSYSRVGSKGQDWELVDCEKILQNVLSNLQLLIEQNNATITHTPLPQITADPSQLTQLFQNLISNAIKFRRETSPQIQIGVEYADDKWLFSVRDNGIGMEVQYLDRIFVIFQRLHSKTEYPGTGIGLAVCKKIVERHGGNLWVDSQPGYGSTFHFTFPYLAGTSS